MFLLSEYDLELVQCVQGAGLFIVGKASPSVFGGQQWLHIQTIRISRTFTVHSALCIVNTMVLLHFE